MSKNNSSIGKSKSIVSLSVLKQSLELVNEDLNVMNEKDRNYLIWMHIEMSWMQKKIDDTN